ncbi:MAG: AAA family ATPase [Phycisphaerales bacterium]|nr:MAG: AAA family ATPase [Phycisphaerales bacterium]
MSTGLKLAIGGKGGVGKTTVCSVWAQCFANEGHDVLAIDADPSLSLGAAFGLPADRTPKPLIQMKALIAERTGTGRDAIGTYFKLNPKVSDLPEEHWLDTGSVKLLVLGGMTRAGGGCACPEGAFLKALLTNTILARDELVLVDLAAGVEFMGRASIQGIDAFVVVVEPGSRSIETANSLAAMARDLGITRVGAIANKITEPAQVAAIASQLTGVALLGTVSYSKSAQEADLNRAPVAAADDMLTQELDDARQRLLDLVCEASGAARPR